MSTETEELAAQAQIESVLQDPEVGHLVLDLNRVVQSHEIPGLEMKADELDDGLRARITVREGVVIEKPVHMCFGVTRQEAVQRIELRIDVEPGARIAILAHCVFPYAVDVQHLMNASIHVGEGASYSYIEKHIHSPDGGIRVVPKANIRLEPDARFRTDFELIKGRVGLIDIDYRTHCSARSVMEMTAKVSGSGDDRIKIREIGQLAGEGARGSLSTRVAVRDRAKADVYNELTASAPGARGHVDCKEILRDQAQASATPVVTVSHPKAHVTHEAAIGSVDKKQLETLMTRGLTEDEASDLIIAGLLS